MRHRILPGLPTPAEYDHLWHEVVEAADQGRLAPRAEAALDDAALRLAAEHERLRAVAQWRDTPQDIARHIAGRPGHLRVVPTRERATA